MIAAISPMDNLQQQCMAASPKLGVSVDTNTLCGSNHFTLFAIVLQHAALYYAGSSIAWL